jgi:hypothetical protein
MPPNCRGEQDDRRSGQDGRDDRSPALCTRRRSTAISTQLGQLHPGIGAAELQIIGVHPAELVADAADSRPPGRDGWNWLSAR